MNEAEWQKEVESIARASGWDYVHFRSERTRPRQSPVITGTLRKGWPDLLLFRGPERIATELKSDTGSPSEEQIWVLNILENAGFRCFIWAPRDRPLVEGVLR